MTGTCPIIIYSDILLVWVSTGWMVRRCVMSGKIGILSDTHGLLRDEVIRVLEGCDVILHGGDINRQEILDELEKIAPVYVVRGNNDKEWAERLLVFLDIEILGLHICMTHKKKDLPKDLESYDLVVCGHSHKYEQKQTGSTLLINPGSCGPRRFNQDITLAILTLSEDSGLKVERIDIPHPQENVKKVSGGMSKVVSVDMKKTVSRVMKEVERGKSVPEIASRLGLDEELAEQICRLYLTHPGVTADQILTKMGL